MDPTQTAWDRLDEEPEPKLRQLSFRGTGCICIETVEQCKPWGFCFKNPIDEIKKR